MESRSVTAVLGASAPFAFVALTLLVACDRSKTKDQSGEPAASASVAKAAAPAPPPKKPTCPADMVEIAGGKFFMGSDADDALDFEKPSHNVTLSAYCIDKNEVTTGQYKQCVDASACKGDLITNDWDKITTKEKSAFDPTCNYRDPDKFKDHPINCVDWTMADAYCKYRGGRLPTEAEWEFAARGPDGRIYPWGDDAPSGQLLNACGKECVAWGNKYKVSETAMYKDDDGWPTTAPVGSFPKGASRYGLNDVVGNVWEWVSDWHAPYTSEPQVDPVGPPKGTERVIRGGAWNGAYPSWVRPTFRYRDAPNKRSYGIGFRCARSLAP